MKITLRVRNLEKNEDGHMEFDSEETARLWLGARPRFVDVLGATFEVPKEVALRLRAAMRPLDEEEKALEAKLQVASDAAYAERQKEERRRAFADDEAAREAARTADPDRPMEIHWTYDHGMSLTDAMDKRPITDEAKEALLSWIAERNEWVHGRGQIVGEATVKVYPGKLPAKETDRVKEGRFFPCAAPEEKPS